MTDEQRKEVKRKEVKREAEKELDWDGQIEKAFPDKAQSRWIKFLYHRWRW
uniref:Uncharacterized protein n=1 Tax=viral metagenome TaxID=1070528 RepID=A0A6H1ZG96_9ZZZZ